MNRVYILCILILTACEPATTNMVGAYFPLDERLGEQSARLIGLGVSVEKRASSGEKVETKVFMPDSLQWANEFEIMKEFNINTAALLGRYNQTEKRDDNSNLSVLRYEATNDELEVKWLEIYYLERLENIKIIKALRNKSNPVFKTEKTMELTFDTVENETTLTSYELNGYQKMIFQDTIYYTVAGEIKF